MAALSQHHRDHGAHATLVETKKRCSVVGETIETQQTQPRSLKRELQAARVNSPQ